MKNKIKELLSKTNEEEIVKCLQEINELLLRNYKIQVGDKIIEPLQVEIYYYHPQRFRDWNVHKSYEQTNNFGKLYFHGAGRGGVDICLSDSYDYFLSVLLKTSKIENNIFSQAHLAKELKNQQYEKIIVSERSKEGKLQLLKRDGLVKESKYKNKELGAMIIELFDSTINFDKANKFSTLIKKFILISIIILLNACSGISKEEFIKDADNIAEIQEIQTNYIQPLGCDKILEKNKKEKLDTNDISDIIAYFGLSQKDVVNIDSASKFDYSILDKCNNFYKSINKENWNKKENAYNKIAHYCNDKYYDETGIESFVWFPFRLTSFAVGLGTLGIVPSIVNNPNCRDGMQLFDSTMFHPWTCDDKTSCEKYLSEAVPVKPDMDIKLIKNKIQNFYIEYKIEQETKHKAEIEADCKEAKNIAEIKLKKIEKELGKDLFIGEGYVISDFASDGVMVEPSPLVKALAFAFIGVFSAPIQSDRAFIYGSTDYVNGESFNDAMYIYRRVGNYKYQNVSGGINSVPAYKKTLHKASELDYKTYLKNKDNVCESDK